MTAYMQSQLAINQCNYFDSIVSLYSILYNVHVHAWCAKYKSLFRVYFNLFRIKNERMRERKRPVNRRVSIKVYRWYRWPHFRSASNFAEIQPLPSETNIKLNCFHTTWIKSWWHFVENCVIHKIVKCQRIKFTIWSAIAWKTRGDEYDKSMTVYRAVGLFTPFWLKNVPRFKQIEHKSPITLFYSLLRLVLHRKLLLHIDKRRNKLEW